MKIIDGKNTVLGRLASFAAKEALNGEEIVIINCDQIIITGNRRNIQDEFKESRKRVGSGQLGPKISRDIIKITKRVIRGMLPNVRHGGRGKDALKRIMCYKGVPKDFEGKKTMVIKKEAKSKFIRLKELEK